ncbi:hypothetical protein Mal4_32880 [Maioricimonas rarisocia]|uniref:Uncharacterized protein n=1 Tax=Maioricimonas rarisocia TaxID=2528026 RepID=A0A517Z920_9PLAN|nr:hypothetical protein [Maioricimonas rarisocia]QDU38956.1 hypothetical protein Mal4_32880 [Maioricimonas rarisocia]
MPQHIREFVEVTLLRWHQSTPEDFGLLAASVVVGAWFISRYCTE